MKLPLISVVMPVYNGEKFLREAIDSILNQTFDDFELIVINDGSVDCTEDIVKSYADSRIVYVKNGKNLRLIKTLNVGVLHARGEYIARMDADDIAYPDRLKRQLDFLISNSVDVVASSYQTIDEDGRNIGLHWISGEKDNAGFNLMISNLLAHPTAFGIAEFFRDHLYRDESDCLHVEDYDLWIRMFNSGARFAIDPRPLLYYRRTSSSVTIRHRDESVANHIKLAKSAQNFHLSVALSDASFKTFLRVYDERLTLKQLLNCYDEVVALYKKWQIGRRNNTWNLWLYYKLGVMSIVKSVSKMNLVLYLFLRPKCILAITLGLLDFVLGSKLQQILGKVR